MLGSVAIALVLARASQETYPQNSAICDRRYPVSDKDRLNCRKDLSGGLECHKPDACTEFDCPDADVARRAGMTCGNAFPHYNGGYPMSAIHWDDENEEYNCLESSPNFTFCQRWETVEESADEYELGDCECQEDNGAHCTRWTCRQRETKKCKGGYTGYPSQRFPTSCTRHCNRRSRRATENPRVVRSSRRRRRSGGGGDDCHDHTYEPETEWENSEAVCVQSDGFRCQAWTQEEWDDHDIAFREYEFYKLNADNVTWYGNIDSEDEFEFARCRCDNVTTSDWCHNWSCYEKGQDYFFPNLAWSILGLALGWVGLMLVLCIGWKEHDAELLQNIQVLSWGWAVIVTLINIAFVWLGGLGELLIFCMCYLLPTLVVSLVFWSRTRDFQARRHQEKPGRWANSAWGSSTQC